MPRMWVGVARSAETLVSCDRQRPPSGTAGPVSLCGGWVRCGGVVVRLVVVNSSILLGPEGTSLSRVGVRGLLSWHLRLGLILPPCEGVVGVGLVLVVWVVVC